MKLDNTIKNILSSKEAETEMKNYYLNQDY